MREVLFTTDEDTIEMIKEEHDCEKVGDEKWVTEEKPKISRLEATGEIDVLDWDYDRDSDMPDLSGPPEPVFRDGDGKEMAGFIRPGETEPEFIELGSWECERCGVVTPAKPDLLNRKLNEPHECRSCERQGPFTHVGAGQMSDQEIQAALRCQNLWFPPSDTDDQVEDVWEEVYDWIHAHWDVGALSHDEATYHGLTSYVLTTWVRENLDFVPHLMLVGKTTNGKTRLLNTLTRVSYRASTVASATPASMFRLIDRYNMTYFISEYHGLDEDAQRELDNIIRAGQKRGEVVTRAEPAETGHEPMSFDPFSHVAVATQYQPADDIINRCIQIQSSKPERDMPATLDDSWAEQIRNKLLYLRFQLLDSEAWDKAEAQAYAELDKRGIDGRTREKLLSLSAMAIHFDKFDEFQPFLEQVREDDEDAAADSEDARFVQVLRDLVFDKIAEQSTADKDREEMYAEIEVFYDEIRMQWEEMIGDEISSWHVGQIRSRLDINKERKRDGTVIRDDELYQKLRKHSHDLGLGWDVTEDSNQMEPDVHDHSDDVEEARKAVVDYLEETGETPTEAELTASVVKRSDYTPDEISDAIERLKRNGTIYIQQDGIKIS